MNCRRPWMVLVVVSTACWLGAAGCGEGGERKNRIVVYRYPEFYQPELKRIAVLPFRNPPQARGAGRRISDQVATALTKNRTYEVYTRTHLADILAERDLADAGIIDAEVAMQIGQAKSVQALVCGSCDHYEVVTHNETRFQPVPVWGRNPQGQPVIVRWKQEPYTWTVHEAVVKCNVVVIDALTGRHIWAANEPSSVSVSGSPPKGNPRDLLAAAENDQIARIIRALAITRTEVKLKGDVLRTAADFYDARWQWQDRFLPMDEQIIVAVKLPPEADRNNFRITIVPKESRGILAEQSFVWSKAHDRRGFPFAVKDIFEKAGLGEYKAKLYSGPEPIATRSFQIVQKR